MGNEAVFDMFSRIGEEEPQNRREREREAQRRLKERMQERMRRERENLQRRQEIEREENRRREVRFREMMERERENQRERMNQRNFQNNNPFFFNRREGQGINNGDLAGIIFRNLFNIHNHNNLNVNNNNNNYNNNNNFNNINININDNDRNNPNNNENKNENNNIVDMIEEIELTQDIINKAETKECSICLEEYYIYNKISYLPCFHFFHTTCIKNWLKNSKKCPLCNIEVKFE
jgi:ATPase subunit of ABC transporter with duplicated ATPase domains